MKKNDLSEKIDGWLSEFHEEVIRNYPEKLKARCREGFSETVYPKIAKFIRGKISEEKLNE